MISVDKLLNRVIEIAKAAGTEILPYYLSSKSLDVKLKANNTPVTLADTLAHQVIYQHLRLLTPFVPILSEEGEQIPFAVRQTWPVYWLVDPLDGTKEFIAATDEFSVNIALIRDGKPILTVVFAPAMDCLYYACEQQSFKMFADQPPQLLHTVPAQTPLRIAVSRYHHGKKLMQFLAQIPHYELIIMGSALKLCLVAEGAADVYLRLGPTSEWDTAAGQCILEQAGGQVLDLQGQSLQYNQKDILQNPSFIALGDKTLPWQSYLKFLE